MSKKDIEAEALKDSRRYSNFIYCSRQLFMSSVPHRLFLSLLDGSISGVAASEKFSSRLLAVTGYLTLTKILGLEIKQVG